MMRTLSKNKNRARAVRRCESEASSYSTGKKCTRIHPIFPYCCLGRILGVVPESKLKLKTDSYSSAYYSIHY